MVLDFQMSVPFHFNNAQCVETGRAHEDTYLRSIVCDQMRSSIWISVRFDHLFALGNPGHEALGHTICYALTSPMQGLGGLPHPSLIALSS